MATGVCQWCGARLSFADRLRGSGLCGACSQQKRDADSGAVAETVVIDGLESVADIARAKQSLSGLPGVRRVTVSSGIGGAFEFAVTHDPDAALPASIGGLPLRRRDHPDVGAGRPGLDDSIETRPPAADEPSEGLLIEGLSSVESVVQMKRLLLQLPGVTGVTVGSRAGGLFEFRICHSGPSLLGRIAEAVPHKSATQTNDPTAPLKLRV